MKKLMFEQKYCVFDLDGTLTYTQSELIDQLPFYLTLTDCVYQELIEDVSTLHKLMQEWKEAAAISPDKIATAIEYNQRIMREIPPSKQSGAAFFTAGRKVAKKFIENKVVIEFAIQFIVASLERGKICIISTASFQEAAEGFFYELVENGLIPVNKQSSIFCSGTCVRWETVQIVHYNTGQNKLVSIAQLLEDKIENLPKKLGFLIGDEPTGGDKALLSLDSCCFARKKISLDEAAQDVKIPENCIWTSWEILLQKIDDISAFHEEQTQLRRAKSTNNFLKTKMGLFPAMIDDTATHIKTLWNYHQLNHEISVDLQVDCIIGLGSYDLTVADRCVELLRSGVSSKLIFTGKAGNWTKGLWTKTEAEIFFDRAVELGVDRTAIFLEKEATNIGENIKFSAEILKNIDAEIKTIVLVTKPNTERRAYATCRQMWPEVELVVTSPRKDLTLLTVAQMEMLTHEMVGDLQRIIHYPALGYQISQEIPHEVQNAYQKLIELGYTQHLLKEVSTSTHSFSFIKT